MRGDYYIANLLFKTYFKMSDLGFDMMNCAEFLRVTVELNNTLKKGPPRPRRNRRSHTSLHRLHQIPSNYLPLLRRRHQLPRRRPITLQRIPPQCTPLPPIHHHPRFSPSLSCNNQLILTYLILAQLLTTHRVPPSLCPSITRVSAPCSARHAHHLRRQF